MTCREFDIFSRMPNTVTIRFPLGMRPVLFKVYEYTVSSGTQHERRLRLKSETLKICLTFIHCSMSLAQMKQTAKLQERLSYPYKWVHEKDCLLLQLRVRESRRNRCNGNIVGGLIGVSVNGQPLYYRCEHGNRQSIIVVTAHQPRYKRPARTRTKKTVKVSDEPLAPKPAMRRTYNQHAERVVEYRLPFFVCETVPPVEQTAEDQMVCSIESLMGVVAKIRADLSSPEVQPLSWLPMLPDYI